MFNQSPIEISGKLMPWQAIPRLDPEAQFVKLPDGRTLVSHGRGFSIRAGCDLTDLGRVLDAVDGRRTAAEIARRLSPFFHGEDLLRFLSNLVGDVLHLDQGGDTNRESIHKLAQWEDPGTLYSVLLVGSGILANELGKSLSQCSGFQIDSLRLSGHFGNPDSEPFPHLVPGLIPDGGAPTNHSWSQRVFHAGKTLDLKPYAKDRNLLIFALDQGTLGQWFWLQSQCMALAVPGLFLVPFQGRIRWQFCLAPGFSGCLACAYLRNLRLLELEPSILLKALEVMTPSLPANQRVIPPLTTGWFSDILFEVLEMFRAPRAGFTHVLDFGFGGDRREFLSKPYPNCPLCADVAAKTKSSTGSMAPVSNLRLAGWRKLTGWQKAAVHSGSKGQPSIQRIAILGGGTAGYLTALALKRKFLGLDVELIESSKVPIIGVGEATTPLMPQFLHGDLGLDVADFFHRVRPTFKLGIHFNWGSSHGFAYPFGRNRVRESLLFSGDLSHTCLNARLMKAGNLPLLEGPKGIWECRLASNTAYHLDNQRFVAYLRRMTLARGIPVLDELVTKARTRGKVVQYLETEDGNRLSYDFYLDCSGFRSLLMSETLGSPFVDYGSSLFTDRAWVAWVPSPNHSRPYTLADTMASGWCWNVPQPGEDHVGYVFCSRYCDDQQALLELREKYPSARDFRLLKFRSGRRRHFLKGNVAAMGNAYGFVEPLESTALHMLIRQIGILLRELTIDVHDDDRHREINDQVGGYWDYLCWFLACHYRFNGKLDTPFWRHCRAEVDVNRHGELIDYFQQQGFLSAAASNLPFPYPDPLWGAEGVDVLLAGQGVPTPSAKLGSLKPEWRQLVREWQHLASQGVSQDRTWELFENQSNLLPEFARVFADVGPAFIHF